MKSRQGQPARSVLITAPSLILVALLASCGGGGDDNSSPGGTLQLQGASAGCSALSGKTLTAAEIGLPTTGATIDSAALVASTATGNTEGEYCRVMGSINHVDPAAPAIKFAINLPTNWNKRMMQSGNGGYSGVLSPTSGTVVVIGQGSTMPLASGYAVYGDDGGHQTPGASFATNAEALANYGYMHIKKSKDVAAKVVAWYYGDGQLEKSYFAGNSTGGREALTAAQRFPADFDAVYSAAPTMFWGLRMIGLPIGKLMYGTPGGYINVAKQQLIQAKVLQACDSLDGLADSIVSNVPDCLAKAPETLASLRCANGADTGDTCLSDAQIAVVNLIHEGLTLPYKMAEGLTRYQGYNILEGTTFAPESGLQLGSSPTLLNPPPLAGNGYLFGQATDWVRNFVTKNPNLDPLSFDIYNPGVYQQTLIDQTSIVGAYSSDLSAFRARGGKIILLQGLMDTAVSPNATIDWYNRVVVKMGAAAANDFIRFYQVPGLGHGSGPFQPKLDVYTALDTWATTGKAPDVMVGTDIVAATAGRTRPICLYPSWPRFNGGDPNSASSYSCATQ